MKKLYELENNTWTAGLSVVSVHMGRRCSVGGWEKDRESYREECEEAGQDWSIGGSGCSGATEHCWRPVSKTAAAAGNVTE